MVEFDLFWYLVHYGNFGETDPNTLDHGLGNTKSNFSENLVWGNLVI